MFLKIYVSLSFILLSKASECPIYIINLEGYPTFYTTVFGTAHWNSTMITNVNATLTDKGGSTTYAGPVRVRNGTRFSLDFFYKHDNFGFLATIRYTKNNTEGVEKKFQVPENCNRSSEIKNRYVLKIFFDYEYFCDLGTIELN
uniref:Salivary lipocalin n=1 Tax=Strongyloides venezuelensis TaxID=75913 RepID=A0A0K0FG01_STRVS